ncbi:MAG TPA: DUF1840 domain-containing protein [Burkholderiaceae bacterium]|jgi:hypothetical protein|nr:DUF1840 domain-containing protein [Burkholderiaceae bacterium]
MIYKFRSRAAADLIMNGDVGDRVLGLIGKTPGAQGIIEVADMARAQAALEAAVASPPPRAGSEAQGAQDGNEPVSLRQRVWPMVEMLKRAQAGGEPIVWGV